MYVPLKHTDQPPHTQTQKGELTPVQKKQDTSLKLITVNIQKLKQCDEIRGKGSFLCEVIGM